MPSTTRSLTVATRVDSSQMSGGFEKALNEQRNFARKTHEVNEGILEEIKKQFGRGSTFKETFEVLKGAGAIAGLHEAGMAFGELTSHAVELREELSKDAEKVDGMTTKMAEGLPVLGGFVKGWNAIGELITGNQAEIDKINEGAKRTTEEIENWAKGMEHGKKAAFDLRVEIARISDPAHANEINYAAKVEADKSKLGPDSPLGKDLENARKAVKDAEKRAADAKDALNENGPGLNLHLDRGLRSGVSISTPEDYRKRSQDAADAKLDAEVAKARLDGVQRKVDEAKKLQGELHDKELMQAIKKDEIDPWLERGKGMLEGAQKYIKDAEATAKKVKEKSNERRKQEAAEDKRRSDEESTGRIQNSIDGEEKYEKALLKANEKFSAKANDAIEATFGKTDKPKDAGEFKTYNAGAVNFAALRGSDGPLDRIDKTIQVIAGIIHQHVALQ